MVNVPAGTTTISGHVGQSLKVSFGFKQRRCDPISAFGGVFKCGSTNVTCSLL
jgi:hypothetical protein